MSVAVIGQGYVGGTLTTVLSERGERVLVFDRIGKRAAGGIDEFDGRGRPASLAGFVEACEATVGFTGIFFVCVPTPMYEDGTADVSIVEEVLAGICDSPSRAGAPHRIAVLKSTVPPGSVQRWNARFGTADGGGLHTVFNPEFLTEANALADMRSQERVVLGGPRPYINEVRNLYRRLFPKMAIIKTSSSTAEMVKYVTNCMLAVKVSFANEMAQICEALDAEGLDIDYDKVIEYATFDRRVGDTHWAVPGPVPTQDGRFVRGFGGHCLPKDINALISVARECGVDPTVLRAAWEKNLEVRGPQDRDWEHQVGRAVSEKRAP
jgi:UDPglucose 6-dehydrogenase